MMQPENEETASLIPTTPAAKGGGDDILIMDDDDDVETPSKDFKSKMHGGGDYGMSLNKLQIRLLAMFQYLKQELSTMDAEKAKRLGLQAKEKALLTALAFKALMLQYVNELKQLDKEKARALGVKYQGKAKELGIKYRAKTVEVAGIARRKAVLVAGELKTMDKQKSIDMMRKGKVVYKEMSPATKVKYGIMFAILFFMMFSSPSGGLKEKKHNHLCYFHEHKKDGKQKVAMCEKMLSEVTGDKTNWIFIGSDPLMVIFGEFLNYVSDKETDTDAKPFKVVKDDKDMRRKVLFYYEYELPNESEWKQKYKNPQNPTKEIASNAGIGQTESKTCKMSKLIGKEKDIVLESLCVEASRDVGQVTTTTSTTQETVARYLSETYPEKKETACVVQQGSYEMQRAPWRTTEEYLEYTKDFHDLLEQHCGILIRIGQFRQHGKFLEKIDEWNEGTRELVLKSSKNGYFIDLSHVNNPAIFTYVEPMWGMFSRLSKALE